MKRALVTGITGQDGSYLAEFLLEKGYEIYGLVRRASIDRRERIRHIEHRVNLVQGDLTDQTSLDEAILSAQPDEVYNLAAQTFVPVSWTQPILTADVTGLGVARLLEAIRKNKPDARFYQASSSEMFGISDEVPQTETTPFHPRSPYGVAKVFGHHLTVNYRESYGLFACSGICFNHESPKRGMDFVTRKVSWGAAQIKSGKASELPMGNLDAIRDWGYAADFMLQQSEPDDYVVATGQAHSVKDLVKIAFDCVGLNWQDHVVIDNAFLRPADVGLFLGDAGKAKKKLRWEPKTDFRSLIELMVTSDLECLSRAR